MTYAFTIHVKKLGIDVPVTVPNDEQLLNHAAHGLKQRINDTMAGYKVGVDDRDEALRTVSKLVVKIESGTVGTRSPRSEASLASVAREMAAKGYIPAMSDDEFAKLLADFVKSRTETAQAPAEAA